MEQVWPKVLEKIPHAEFHIAGRNTPDWLLNRNWKNVTIHGEVPDAADFINAHNVMLVPLFSGSGMRVKILEGMALGKVVLSTHLGLEGIHAEHNKNVLIADEVEHFVAEIVNCFSNPQLIQTIGKAALEFIHQYYDNVAIARRLLASYKELVGNVSLIRNA